MPMLWKKVTGFYSREIKVCRQTRVESLELSKLKHLQNSIMYNEKNTEKWHLKFFLIHEGEFIQKYVSSAQIASTFLYSSLSWNFNSFRMNSWKNSFSLSSSFLHFSLFDFYFCTFCTKSRKDPQAWSNVYNRRLQAGCYL